jgi:FtsP/CotA-like multicopper oxidase with cupredoxin domain
MDGGPGGAPNQPVFKIDGEQFQEGQIDQIMLLGNAEEWTIVNTSLIGVTHPFHIHINPFQLTEIYDPHTMKAPQKLPTPWIWWDTIAIPAGVKNADGTITPGHLKIRSRFVDFPGKYVLHCHILGHEDRGMMQLVEVVDNKTVVKHH